MKKKRKFRGIMTNIPALKKILTIMKLSVFFFSLGVIQVFGAIGYSQSEKMNLSLENVTVEQVLSSIEDQSKYYFLLNQKLINLNRKVNIRAEDESISDILEQLFAGTSVKHLVADRQIILSTTTFTEKGFKLEDLQQQKVITGVVKDRNGSPLPGVSVTIKGTYQGTITDMDGKFTLSVTPDAEILVFSFVGMRTQEIVVGRQTNIDVVLEEDVIGIEEVVTIGYGTMRKSDLTGSTLRINMTDTEEIPNTNLSQALSGYFAGVNASSAGRPGSTGSLTIRGRTTLSASESPLIVLDGIIYNGSISSININDIESIDVLKDASAAAVYGARAANGVLLINTKRGKSDKPLFEFNTYYGFQKITNTKRTQVMNGEQFAISRVDHAYQQILRTWYQTGPTDASLRPARPDVTNKQLVATYLRTQEESDNYLSGYETNWIDEALQTAPTQNYNLSVSGRTERTNYFLSASYADQEGILMNNRFKRQTLMANFDNDITDWLTLGLHTFYSYMDNSGLFASLDRALIGSPLANIYTEEGNYTNNLAGDPYVRNPLEDIPVDNTNTNHTLNMALSGKLVMPGIKGLTYDINYARSLYFYFNNSFYPSSHTVGLTEIGLGTKDISKSKEWLMNHILTYKRTFNDDHRVNATLAYTREKRTGEGSNLQATGFDNQILGYHALEIGTNQNVNSSAWQNTNEAFMARANYTYLNRYLLTATFRRDGYSGFGINNKYANFPSIGLGWVISEEKFLETLEWLNLMKLRISYGLNGNQGIGAYSSLARMASTHYVFGNLTAVGIYPSAMGNSGLRWESTATVNLGLDFAVIDQRVSGTIDIYKSTSSDVLVLRTVPQTTGYSNIWDNVSELKNKGIELAINTVNIKSSRLRWNSKFIFSLNRNEITEIYEGVTEDIGNRWFVGEPINAHYDYQIDGVWQEEDLFNGTILSPYLPGDFKLVDLNDDGVINVEDRFIIGYPDPNFRFGINNDVSFGNFSLNVFINSIQGGNGYYIDDPGRDAARVGGADRALRTNRTAAFDYWTPFNPVNDQPAMFYPYEGFHESYFSRSFIRLQEISLGYNFDREKLHRYKMNELKIYISGKNLYTWTDWPGIDPELTGDNIPMMRSLVLGVKVSF